APAVPGLVSPANGATGVSVPALIRWRTADRATQYHLQVSTSSTFAGGMVVDDSTLTDTTSSVAGLAGKTQYYWRVRSKNAAGGSAYSGTWSFETGLGVPSLLTPADGATGRQQPVQLTWASVTGAVTYHVQVSTESGFTSGLVVDDATVAGLSKSVSGLAGTTLYYWRVAAHDAGGDGPFATARTFTTSVNSPGLLSPADNAVDQPLSLTLSWSAVTGATYYHVQVSTDAGFGTGMVLDDPAATGTSRVLSGLAQSTRYYWRVSAGDPGGEGAYSTSRSFTTIFPAPVLLTPANGVTGQPLGITFTWNRVSGAVRYHLQLATDTLFTALIKNDTTITDSVRQVNGLVNATWYYWRVKAIAATTGGPFSPRRSFRTAGILPPAVTLLAPAQGAMVPGDSARCSWNTASSATRYWLELGLDSLFTLKLVDSTVTDTAKMVRSLLPNTTYWWKVRGGTTDGWGPFSSTRQFMTVTVDVAELDESIPQSYALEQNYPNPFNPATTIRFALPSSGNARLEVYNMLGERVATILDEIRSAGVHAVRFDADGLPSGTYFYRLTAGGEVRTRRMVLLR
ncbi:MAG: T9SS type A sorting domain-containing protein, partial [Bacteroidetes bacterium]|nr:T9SS type A sorting domain-containing protein [Bacteroidota bacterium]